MKNDLKKLRADAAEAQSKANYRKALSLYEEVCENDPADPLAHHRAGELFGRLGRPNDAVRRLRQGADLYAKQGFLVKAIAVCKMILQIEPGHEETQSVLLELYSRKTENDARGPQFTAPPPPRAPTARPSTQGGGGRVEPISLAESGGAWSGGAGSDGGQTAMHLMGSVLDDSGSSVSYGASASSESASSESSLELADTLPPLPPARRPGSPQERSPARAAVDELEIALRDSGEFADLGLRLPPTAKGSGAVAASSVSEASQGVAAQKARRSANEIRGGVPRSPSVYGQKREDSGAFAPAAFTRTAGGDSEAASLSTGAPRAPASPPPPPPPPPVKPTTLPFMPTPPAPPPPREPVMLTPLSPTVVPPPRPVSRAAPPGPAPLPASPPSMPGPAFAWPGSSNPSTPPVRPSFAENASATESGASITGFTQSGFFRAQKVGADAGRELADAIEIAIDDEPAPSHAAPAQRGLPETELFAGLDRVALRELIEKLEFQRYERGTAIAREGEVGDALYVIADGEVVVTVAGAPPREVGRLKDGDFFGEISVISNFPRTATVTALVDTEVLCLSRAVIWNLVGKYPDFLAKLIRFVRDRLIETLQKTSPLFLALPPGERATLASRFKLLEVEEQKAVVQQGQKSDGLFVLLGGRFEVLVQKDGAEHLIGELGPGAIVGEISLLTRKPADSTVRTTRRCWVLWMAPNTFSEILMTYPTVLEYVHELAEERQQATSRLQMV